MRKVLVRDAFNAFDIYQDPGTDPGGPSLTDQSQQRECDINEIVNRMIKTGVQPGLAGSGIYGDFSSVPDYHAACNLVLRAEEQFMSLDAKTRQRFNNDPGAFLEFCSTPGNGQEMYELGLTTSPPKPAVNAPLGASSAVSPPSQPAPAASVVAAQQAGSTS